MRPHDYRIIPKKGKNLSTESLNKQNEQLSKELKHFKEKAVGYNKTIKQQIEEIRLLKKERSYLSGLNADLTKENTHLKKQLERLNKKASQKK